MSTNAPITSSDGWFISEDKAFQFTVVNQSAAGATSTQDITGWTIKFVLSATNGGSAVFTKTAALTTPTSGICTITIAKADTSALAAQDYYYALWRTDTGSYTLLAYGTATLQASDTVVP